MMPYLVNDPGFCLENDDVQVGMRGVAGTNATLENHKIVTVLSAKERWNTGRRRRSEGPKKDKNTSNAAATCSRDKT